MHLRGPGLRIALWTALGLIPLLTAGPAASQAAPPAPTPVYADATRAATHLSGYAFVDYVSPEGGDGAFTQAGFNPIFHYVFDDRVLVEAELELGSTEAGETEVVLEYVTVDLFLTDTIVLVAGKFLSPLGTFQQNVHPAWINRFASAPPGYAHGGVPTNDVGVQLRGVLPRTPLGRITYALALTNGPGLAAEGGMLEEVMTEGATRTAAGRAMTGGRIGFIPASWMDLGLSYAAGRTRVMEDENGEVMDDPPRDYRYLGADLLARPWTPLEFRGEYARQSVDEALGSVAPDKADWTAWYVQAAYRFSGAPLEPVLRFGRSEAPLDDMSQEQWGFGLNWWLTASTVVKVGYESNSALVAGMESGDRSLLQVAHGF